MNFIFFTSSAQITQFVISTTTTNNANEYQWDILDSDSTTILFSSSVFSDSTMVNDTVMLSTKDCKSLEEANDIQKLKIFPNPNNGTFNLSLDNFS